MISHADDNKKEFQLWIEDCKPDKTASVIISLMKFSEILLRENGIICGSLFEIDEADAIGNLANDLKSNRSVRIHSKSRRSASIHALFLYKEYLDAKRKKEESIPKGSDLKSSTEQNIASIDFTKPDVDFCGWLIETEGMAKSTGRSYASAINSCDCFCREHSIGTGRICAAESSDEIRTNIGYLLENDGFLDCNKEQHNRLTAALAKYQKYMEIQGFAYQALTSSTPTETKDISSTQNEVTEIENVVLQADMEGISYDDLQDRTGKTKSKIQQLVFCAKKIVEIKGTLYHEDALIDWNDGIVQLDTIIEKMMKKNNGYISAAQLYEYARTEMYMFLNDNGIDDERAVYEIAQHLFEKNAYNGKHYTFTGKLHISRSASVTSKFDVICKYAEDQGGVFRFSDLEAYLTSVGIRHGNLRGQMRIYTDPTFLYYDEDVLIYTKNMSINEEWKSRIKMALEKLFVDVGDHIILRDIQPLWFEQLPKLSQGLHWTPMLLQNILRYYGKELGAHTIIAMDSQSIETLHAMLVRNDSPIQNFGDVIISLLLENENAKRTFTAEELRLLLAALNVIQGRELIGNMPKALEGDERFAWDADSNIVTIRT